MHLVAWCAFVLKRITVFVLSNVVYLATWCSWETPQICCLHIIKWKMNEWRLLPRCLSHTLLRGGDDKLWGQVGSNVVLECYLVDPASNHMLVLKIKSCMCKYELTWNCEWLIKLVIVCLMGFATPITIVILELICVTKPRFLEGMQLLDKRLMQALSVALMIHDNSTLCIDSIEKYSRFKMLERLRSK